MIHPELLPTAADLPALQLALDSVELTPNEGLLLLAAGPALADAADPTANLADAVAGAAPPDIEAGDSENSTPLASLLNAIGRATPDQRRALAVYALQNTWVSEGIELPGGGISLSE